MRKLTAGLFMSLDGVVESPNLWQFDSFDEELGVQMALPPVSGHGLSGELNFRGL